MTKPEIDAEGLAAFKAELERWGDVEDTWEPAHAALRAYLAATRTSEAAEPVAHPTQDGQSVARVGFEEWANARGLDLAESPGAFGGRVYVNPHTQSMWDGWFASWLTHTSSVSEEVTDALEFYGERASSLASRLAGASLGSMSTDDANYVQAILTELSLDAGHRSVAALASLRSPKP